MQPHCDIQTLIDILHTKVGVPLDTPNIATDPWEEIGVDSLALTEVCTNLEHKLGITIPQEGAFSTKNVQELITFVNSMRDVGEQVHGIYS